MENMELSDDQINQLIDFKMKKMELEYLECRKYDIKSTDTIELKGKFEQAEFNHAEFENVEWKPKDTEQNPEDSTEKTKDTQEKQQENNDNEENEEEEEEDNEIPQGYEQIDSDEGDNNDEDLPEVQTSEIDFDSQPHQEDPRTKEIDIKKIQHYMSQFTIKEPDWAKDPEQWKQKLQNIGKENK